MSAWTWGIMAYICVGLIGGELMIRWVKAEGRKFNLLAFLVTVFFWFVPAIMLAWFWFKAVSQGAQVRKSVLIRQGSVFAALPPGTNGAKIPSMVGRTVLRRRFDGCMAHVLGDVKTGIVLNVGSGKDKLPHYPPHTPAWLVKWEDGKKQWEPAAAFYKLEDGSISWDY